MRLFPKESLPKHEILEKKKSYFLFFSYETSIVLGIICAIVLGVLFLIYVVMPRIRGCLNSRKRGRVASLTPKTIYPSPSPLLLQILREEEQAKRARQRAEGKESTVPLHGDSLIGTRPTLTSPSVLRKI